MPTPTPPPPALLAATRSTFEALALLFAEPLASAPGEPCHDPRGGAARVTFRGDAAAGPLTLGALTVAVSGDVADALAANMLGTAHAGPAERRDAVGELANVVCGNVLPLLAGREAVFRLGAPELLAPGAPPAPPAAGAARCEAWFDVEGGRAHVVLDVPVALLAAAAEPAARAGQVA